MRAITLSLLLLTGCGAAQAIQEDSLAAAKEAAAVTMCEVKLVEAGLAESLEVAHPVCLNAYLAAELKEE